MKVVKKYYDLLSSAHFLPNYAGKCKQLHGHNYHLDVIIEGEINPDTGMVEDFHDIDSAVRNIIEAKADHVLLNDRFDNPTAENMACWIYGELKKRFPGLLKIRLWENTTSYVEVP